MKQIKINTLPGFENISDIYSVTENGQVWSDYKKDYLKLYIHYNSKELQKKWENKELEKQPYHWYQVGLREKGNPNPVWVNIHRLVALAFIPNPNKLDEVNHKDKITEHNFVDNLEWCDKKYNVNYSLAKKVWQCDKKTHEKIKLFNSFAEAAKAVNGHHSNIIAACKRKRKSAYGFFWEYQ